MTRPLLLLRLLGRFAATLSVWWWLTVMVLTAIPTHALHVYIDAATGEMVISDDGPPPGVTTGLWPDESAPEGTCTSYADAQFTPHDARYSIAEWLFIEADYGPSHGSVATHVSVYDLRQLVAVAHAAGVWHQPQDCAAVWQLMRDHIIRDATRQIAAQSRPTVTARAHGIVIDVQCRGDAGSQMPERYADEYEPCTRERLHHITNAGAGLTHPTRSYRHYKRQNGDPTAPDAT